MLIGSINEPGLFGLALRHAWIILGGEVRFFFTKSTKLVIPVVINLTTLSVIFSISYCVYNI